MMDQRRRQMMDQHKSFVTEEFRSNKPSLLVDVYVWEITIGNHELPGNERWISHVLAGNVHDAAQVAEELTDSEIEIVQSVRLIGCCGVRAAPNVLMLTREEFKEFIKTRG